MNKYPTRHIPKNNKLEMLLDSSRDLTEIDVLEAIENSPLVNPAERQKKQAARAHQIQKDADLYRAVIELPAEDFKQKLSLFLSLALMQQKQIERYEDCLQAIAEQQLPSLIHHITDFSHGFGWQHESLKAIKATQSTIALTAFKQATEHLAHHYPPKQATVGLQRDLKTFCQKFSDELNFFDLHDDIKRLVQNFINPDNLSNPAVVMDGFASIGLLTQSLEYPVEVERFILQTTDPMLSQIGQQLHQIHPIGAKLDYQNHNPLDGHTCQPQGIVDLYLSFAPVPCNLKPHQREPQQAFRMINYPGRIPSFASDAVWVQYALFHLKPQGQAFVVVQDGFLRRSGYDAALREYLVKHNLLTAVISLHPKQARQTQYSQLSMLVLDKSGHNPTTRTQKDVYFYYLRNLPEDLGAMSFFDSNIAYDWAMHPWYDEATKAFYVDELEVGTVDFYKTADELQKENYNLSFEHYLGYQRKTDYPNYQQIDAEFHQSVKKLMTMLEQYSRPWD